MRADKKAMSRLLKTARGQIDGVLKMMEEDKYCVDIANQIMAADAILKKAYREIIRAHMQGCVREAFCCGNEAEQDKKIEEITAMLERLAK